MRHTFQSCSHRFVGIDNTSIFGLVFLPWQLVGVYKALPLAPELPTFYDRFSWCLNSSSSGSMKKIPRICLTLSSFGFSIAHLCFALLFAASDICFHISGHSLSGLEVVCFLVSLSPDHVYPSGGLSFSKICLVRPVHASDNSLSPSTFQSSSICFSNNISDDVCVVLVTSVYFIGIGKDFSFWHVQFDSWYNVMTTNEISRNRPEIISSFRIIPC